MVVQAVKRGASDEDGGRGLLMSTKPKHASAPSALLAGFLDGSGARIELRKGEHGYFTVRTHADGSRTAMVVSAEKARGYYTQAMEEGTAWSWS
jgi:hypothetical protein